MNGCTMSMATPATDLRVLPHSRHGSSFQQQPSGLPACSIALDLVRACAVCSCWHHSFYRAGPQACAAALTLALHTNNSTCLSCGSASALITLVCTGFDLRNGPCNVHQRPGACICCCVTNPRPSAACLHRHLHKRTVLLCSLRPFAIVLLCSLRPFAIVLLCSLRPFAIVLLCSLRPCTSYVVYQSRACAHSDLDQPPTAHSPLSAHASPCCVPQGIKLVSARRGHNPGWGWDFMLCKGRRMHA